MHVMLLYIELKGHFTFPNLSYTLVLSLVVVMMLKLPTDKGEI